MKFKDIPLNNYFSWNQAYYKKVSPTKIKNIYGGEVSFYAQNEEINNVVSDLNELLPKTFKDLNDGDYFRIADQKQLYYKVSATSMRKFTSFEGSTECPLNQKIDFVGSSLAIHFYSLEQWDTPTFFE